MSDLLSYSKFNSDIFHKYLLKPVYFGLLIFVSFYPIYKSVQNGIALQHYGRHQALLDRTTFNYNPWQYRVLAPAIVESVYFVANNTVYKLVDFNKIALRFRHIDTSGKELITQRIVECFRDPEYIKYFIVFVFVRWIINFVLFALVLIYWSYFTRNIPLLFLAFMTFSLSVGNSVNDTDFAFNTYLDLIFYVLAALIILQKKRPWLILLLSILGALNRETALLIPFLYFSLSIDLPKLLNRDFLHLKRAFTISFISLMAFISIFVFLRWYFGYVPQEVVRVEPGWPMLKLNLLSAASIKSYMEIYGTFMLLPLFVLFQPRKISYYLIVCWIVIVPVWFTLNLAKGFAFQSRLFLVPTVLIFFPMILEKIEFYNVSKIKNPLGSCEDSL